ncbi:uncharacterized protein PHACADRAFT_257207 [Phanerochaete carnosa HHB-10118-sp]|uniref:Condensation domain-containing protein n=1 Tax=Phanerochaete carnosa (strain HHB-10118-sp) TaxID=650164 RepID=K5WAW4_PHACS|nr:uncharacterized protein PHACADRAFT_257207 [Phanerochaete carnosa HHB-10118-sp]EKM56129.1 hypothetical protein PHACADRAFT_257207 [Phanerochaete carnosa HHB-10118-sp]
MERYHVLLSQLGFDSCVAIAGKYVSVSGTPLTKEVIYPALHTMMQTHAGLGMQIAAGVTRADIPKYVRLPEVDLDAVVEFLEDSAADVDELLRAQLGRPFALGTSAPLWRVTVVNGATVVFAAHHAIADGQSGPALHATLLSALNDTATDQSKEFDRTVAVPQAIPLAEPTEAYMNISLSWSSIFHLLYQLLVPKSWLPSATAWTGNSIPPVPSLDMHVRCWSVSAAQTREILRRCREHGTTLTAFLHTLLVGVLARVLAEERSEEASACSTVNVAVPVSLRRFTGVPPRGLCNHISTVYFFSPLRPVLVGGGDFSWEATRAFGKELHGSVSRAPELLGKLRLLFRCGVAESYFRGILGKRRASGMGLSNLGPFPVAKQEGEVSRWTISNVFFAQCDVVRGAAVKVNVVGSPEGTTNVAFTWGKASLDEDLANTLIREVKTTLDAMLEP